MSMIRAGHKWWKRGGADKSLTCGDVVERGSGLVGLGCKAGTVPTPRQGAGNTRGGSRPRPFCAARNPLKPLSKAGGEPAVMKFAGPIIACPKTQVTTYRSVGGAGL